MSTSADGGTNEMIDDESPKRSSVANISEACSEGAYIFLIKASTLHNQSTNVFTCLLIRGFIAVVCNKTPSFQSAGCIRDHMQVEMG